MLRVGLSCGCIAFFGEEALEKAMAGGGTTPCFDCGEKDPTGLAPLVTITYVPERGRP